jgi:hypothetical protein
VHRARTESRERYHEVELIGDVLCARQFGLHYVLDPATGAQLAGPYGPIHVRQGVVFAELGDRAVVIGTVAGARTLEATLLQRLAARKESEGPR